MLDKRKAAKDLLNDMGRTDFYKTIHEAKLTPRQEGILELKFIRDWSYVQIAFKFCVDVNVIKQDMQKAYDKIYKLFLNDIIYI